MGRQIMKIFTYRNFGYEGQLSAVETEIRRGIPMFDIEGIPEQLKKDATMLIKAAFDNQQEAFPMERVRTVISPSARFKEGEFELAAALSIIEESRRRNGWQEISKEKENEPVLALGRLDLAGAIEPAEAAYAAAQAAVKKGIKNIICCEEDAVSLSKIDGARIAVAENLSEAINAMVQKSFVMRGEEITASMPLDAKKNAEENFNQAIKERGEHGNGSKAAFEFVMDYVSDAYSLSDKQKSLAEKSLRHIEEKYYKGGYDSEERKFGKENSEQALFDLYEDLSSNSTESLEAFGWMDKSVKNSFAEDLFEKLGTALHMRTDIDYEKLEALRKNAENSVSFNERESVVEAAEDRKAYAGLFKTARAIEVAVAGKHNIMLEGASEDKNRLIEKLVPYLTPDITEEEAEASRRISSINGTGQGDLTAPFREPPKAAYLERIAGGGVDCVPGEVSLAHNGVLFIKNANDFRTTNLQMLRLPLVNRNIVLARAGRSTEYPAHFQLVLTAGSSPDGSYGSRNKICLDSPSDIQDYRLKVNGPLGDRIEIKEFVEKDQNDIRVFKPEEARKRVAEAYRIQRKRGIFNRDLSPADISKYCALDKESAEFFKKTVTTDEFSRRAAANILKVSLTLANMEGRENIMARDIAEAHNLILPAPEKYREVVRVVNNAPEYSAEAKNRRLAMDLAGLCAARHLAAKKDEGYKQASENVSNFIKEHSKELKKFGVNGLCDMVNTRVALQDRDTDLVGLGETALRERHFLRESLEKDLKNILPEKNKQRHNDKQQAEMSRKAKWS